MIRKGQAYGSAAGRRSVYCTTSLLICLELKPNSYDFRTSCFRFQIATLPSHPVEHIGRNMGQSRAVLSSEALSTQRPSGAILALRKSFSANKLSLELSKMG